MLRCLTATLSIIFTLSAPLHASDPVIRFDSGPVISPAAATTYYTGQPGGLNSGAARTLDDPRLVELSRALQGNADLIDEFIRRNIRTTAHFGLQKGGVGALLDGASGPLDQAQLMVDLVRAGGGTARYARGIATMSAADIRTAFGIPAGADVIQALANGGIPVSGGGGTVSFLHVWVQVQTPQGWVSYDPALKVHEYSPPLNLASLAGLDASGFRSRALAGTTSGTDAGISWISGLNRTNIGTDLEAHAVRFLNAMRGAAYQGADLTDVVGGVRLLGEPMVVPDGAAHPFAGSPAGTFNEVPDVLRTRLRIRVPVAQIDTTLFLDQYAGRRITIKWDALDGAPCGVSLSGCGNTFATQFRGRLFAGHTMLSQIDDSLNSNTSDLPIGPTERFVVANGLINLRSELGVFEVIVIDLISPYAAGGGNYANQTYSTTVNTRSQSEIIAVGGAVVRQGPLNYSQAVRSHRYRSYYDSDHVYEVYDFTCPTGVAPPCLVDSTPDAEQMYAMELWAQGREISIERDVYWREWVASREHAAQILDGINQTFSNHQFTLGVATGHDPAWLDAVTHLTVSDNGVSSNVEGTRFGYAYISAIIEEQVVTTAFMRSPPNSPQTGQWRTNGRSGASVFGRWPSSLSQRFYFITPGQTPSSTLMASLGQVGNLQGQLRDVGLSVIAGTFQSSIGQHQPVLGLIASTTDRLGVLALDVDIANQSVVALRKGGGAVPLPELPSPDFVRTRIENPGLRVLDVDLRTGAFSHTPAPDVTAGGGAFPYSLPFQRNYSSQSQSPYPLGQGWTHNWDLYASIGASAFQITMEDDPALMAPTVAALLLLSTASTWSNPLERHLAGATLSTQWFDHFVDRSTVTVHLGEGSELFVRLADGTYRGPRNSQSSLNEVSGSGGSYPTSFNESVDYLYRGPGGDTIRFEAVTANDIGGDGPSGRDTWLRDRFPATVWTFPVGVTINLNYRPFTGTLQRVTNSLGWALEFETVDRICTTNYQPPVPPYEMDTECEGRSGRYRLIERVVAKAPGGSVTEAADFFYHANSENRWVPPASVAVPVLLQQVRTPATGSGVLRYRYGVHGSASFIPQTISHIALTEIFDPMDTTNPVMRQYYADGAGLLPARVSRVSVRASGGYVNYDYFVTGDRGAYRDPGGAVFASFYDRGGRLDRVIDPVGRATANTFDGAGRVVETRVYSHPDRAVYAGRTTFVHDARGNVIEEAVHPRINPSTGLPFAGAPLVTTREFHPVWNRPTRITDPRGSETVIVYDAVRGLVLREEGPSGEVVIYQYNAYGQPTRVEVEAGQ